MHAHSRQPGCSPSPWSSAILSNVRERLLRCCRGSWCYSRPCIFWQTSRGMTIFGWSAGWACFSRSWRPKGVVHDSAKVSQTAASGQSRPPWPHAPAADPPDDSSEVASGPVRLASCRARPSRVGRGGGPQSCPLMRQTGPSGLRILHRYVLAVKAHIGRCSMLDVHHHDQTGDSTRWRDNRSRCHRARTATARTLRARGAHRAYTAPRAGPTRGVDHDEGWESHGRTPS